GIFGISGGIGADPENLMAFKQTADRLFGQDYRLSAFGIGRAQMPMLAMTAVLGGNVRVGLEDSLYIGRRQLARSNAEQVAKIRRIIEELGMDIASPDEARAMLGLKGADRVNF
ncbi:MAG: 3-keto-5-aminohexanoate cleavage protein, partial [Gemmobacter sp.]